MITLEDQIRRYAVDVAGPAVAEPSADLHVVGRPRHRGRWVLVAALVVFIAGLTWVATRPTELGDRPSVDTLATPVTTEPTIVVPADVLSTPKGPGPCGGAGSVGVILAGVGGEGLCVASVPYPVGTPMSDAGALSVAVYLGSESTGGGGAISECFPYPVDGELWPTMVLVTGGQTVIAAEVPPNTATARTLAGTGPKLVAFDLPRVEGSRFVAARVPDSSWVTSLKLYDESGQPVFADASCPSR